MAKRWHACRYRKTGTGLLRAVTAAENGAVFMAEADCPDSLCVQMGKIYREGESIVCLPHGLVIRIEKASS